MRFIHRLHKFSHFGLIYRRGIEIFEKSGLVFKTGEIPVLFRGDYLEWHLPGPGGDFSNLDVKAGKHEQDIYEALSLSGDDFSLTLSKCRIERSGGLVEIFPLVEKPGKKKPGIL